MNTETVWAVELDGEADITLDEMMRISCLGAWELEALGEFDIPQGGPVSQTYRASGIMELRVAGRLREDFDLDVAGLAVALALLERIARLERELGAALARIPRPSGLAGS